MGHNQYDLLIESELEQLEDVFRDDAGQAYKELNEIVNKYKSKMVNDIMGSTKKLDDLK